MTTTLGPLGTPNSILFVEDRGHITDAIAVDFATYGNEAGPGDATEAQKQALVTFL